MAKIGSFGDERHIEQDTFDWFGQEMRVNALAGEQAYIDFLEVAGTLDERDPQAAVAVKTFMREIVHGDDFDDFWRIGREKRQDTADLFKLAQKIIEAVVATHPTEQSSDSPAGLPATAPSSTAASYKEVRQELEQNGRPDLSLVYLEAEEAKVAS